MARITVDVNEEWLDAAREVLGSRGGAGRPRRLMAASIYLADTSVYVLQGRHPDVRHRFESLLMAGRLAVCEMTALEYLNNAPDPDGYETLWRALHAQRWLAVNAAAMTRALEVHRVLAAKSQHRHFRLPDLVIAATAEVHGATVLHYDADYERIAAVTDQPVEWVVPPGSL
jgi:predicted nucleic acid-binding protein